MINPLSLSLAHDDVHSQAALDILDARAAGMDEGDLAVVADLVADSVRVRRRGLAAGGAAAGPDREIFGRRVLIFVGLGADERAVSGANLGRRGAHSQALGGFHFGAAHRRYPAQPALLDHDEQALRRTGRAKLIAELGLGAADGIRIGIRAISGHQVRQAHADPERAIAFGGKDERRSVR